MNREDANAAIANAFSSFPYDSDAAAGCRLSEIAVDNFLCAVDRISDERDDSSIKQVFDAYAENALDTAAGEGFGPDENDSVWCSFWDLANGSGVVPPDPADEPWDEVV